MVGTSTELHEESGHPVASGSKGHRYHEEDGSGIVYNDVIY